MKNLVRIGALALAAALVPTQDAAAQVGFGAQGSYDFAGEGAFGAGARATVGVPTFPLAIQGTFDYFFPGDDDVLGELPDYWRLGLNAIYSFLPVNVGVSPYVGGGIDYLDVDGFDSDTGWQLLGGATFGFESLITPFAEVRWINHDDGEFLISVGLNF